MNNEALRNTSMETRCVQGGYIPENTGSRIMPIVQSTTFMYETADELGDVFDLKQGTPLYSRLGNPSLSWVEEKIALLEGGVAAISASSGQAAILFTILNITKQGQHVLAMRNLYGGTHTLFASQLARLGIEVTFVAPDASLDELKSHIRPETRLIYGETIGNPTLEVLDFEKMSALAKYADVPLVVDNTFPSPYLCQPLAHGADIVIHSATKYLDGHATSLGGFVVDGGSFNWNNGKYPELAEPCADYHGMVFTEAFGKAAFVAKIRAGLLRDIGATMAPMNAFLINLGMETLHLRMERHSQNAQKVAEFLAQDPRVDWVVYPGLADSPDHALAEKYLPKGCSGVVAFGPKGGAQAADSFINNMKLATLVTHVGDLRTHALQPARTTHRQLSEEDMQGAGISPEFIRYSVGIEHIDDILHDLDQALGAI